MATKKTAAGTKATTETTTEAVTPSVAGPARTARAVRTPGGSSKSNRNVYLPDELYSRARNAVAWTALVPGESGSFSALVERTLRAEVERLETLYNQGRPFGDSAEAAGLSSTELLRRLRVAYKG